MDIGGYHDGLILILSLLLRPFASTFFHKNFVQDLMTDPYRAKNISKVRHQTAIKVRQSEIQNNHDLSQQN